mgnify:CR=1 FL=1
MIRVNNILKKYSDKIIDFDEEKDKNKKSQVYQTPGSFYFLHADLSCSY